jgi:hypothetical protein
MESKYGQIAESSKINKAIYDCFDFLDEKEQKKFVKKFKEQPHSQVQVIHTFRELILGTYLRANGSIVENERKICRKTPDWSILDSSSNVNAVVEMVYHHIDNKTNDDILAQLKTEKNIVGYWPHSNDPGFLRLYSHIEEKASKYKELVADLQIPFVVAVFIDFLAVIDVQEVQDCLLTGEEPLFKSYPDLSGVLHFEESILGSYYFEFIENPYAIRKIEIPNGFLKTNHGS